MSENKKFSCKSKEIIVTSIEKVKILLQTMGLSTFEDHRETKLGVNVLFDSGNQTSYVKGKLKNNIPLKTRKRANQFDHFQFRLYLLVFHVIHNLLHKCSLKFM